MQYPHPVQFAVYVNERGLEPYLMPADDNLDFFLSWYPFSNRIKHLEWWDPTDSFDNTYIISGESWWKYAKPSDAVKSPLIIGHTTCRPFKVLLYCNALLSLDSR